MEKPLILSAGVTGKREKGHMPGMSRPSKPAPSPFTAPERDLLRRELGRHFGQDPAIADGIFLRYLARRRAAEPTENGPRRADHAGAGLRVRRETNESR